MFLFTVFIIQLAQFVLKHKHKSQTLVRVAFNYCKETFDKLYTQHFAFYLLVCGEVQIWYHPPDGKRKKDQQMETINNFISCICKR